jgi:chorismate-pyruvate lyase
LIVRNKGREEQTMPTPDMIAGQQRAQLDRGREPLGEPWMQMLSLEARFQQRT